MTRKKILIIGKNPPPFYGTSIWFETLQKANWSDDFELLFFDNNVNKKLNSLGKISFSKLLFNIKLYFEFKKYLKKHKVHLVLIPFSQTTLGFVKDSIYINIAKKRTKTLLILHGANFLNWSKSASSLIRKYITKTFKNTSGIIVLGENLKCLFDDYFKNELIFSVPNGLTINVDSVEKSHKKLKLIYLGNLQKSKGIKDLIDAIALIDNSKIELEVIGQWRDEITKKYCIDKRSELNLNVHFLGPKYGSVKLEFLANADLFIFTPNKPEGHPLVLIEAMANSLPIISSNQGAISESVIEGKNGFIVKSNSPNEIAEKINFFIENEVIRIKMGEKSKEIYLNNFTSEKMIENYEKIFYTLVK